MQYLWPSRIIKESTVVFEAKLLRDDLADCRLLSGVEVSMEVTQNFLHQYERRMGPHPYFI